MKAEYNWGFILILVRQMWKIILDEIFYFSIIFTTHYWRSLELAWSTLFYGVPVYIICSLYSLTFTKWPFLLPTWIKRQHFLSLRPTTKASKSCFKRSILVLNERAHNKLHEFKDKQAMISPPKALLQLVYIWSLSATLSKALW